MSIKMSKLDLVVLLSAVVGLTLVQEANCQQPQSLCNVATQDGGGGGLTATCGGITGIGQLSLQNNWRHLRIDSSPRLQLLPRDFAGSAQLESLRISGNFAANNQEKPALDLTRPLSDQITIPADAFAGLQQLKSLAYTDSRLVFVYPGALNNLPSLNELNLRNNLLISVPKAGTLSELKTLDLSANKISEIPNEIFDDLIKLRTLDLSDNNILELGPYSFQGLTLLTNLFLNDNQITGVSPMAFAHLPALEELNLARNSLTTVPKLAFQYATNILSRLDLSENRLTVVQPGAFGKFEYLRTLNISHNRLETLPGNALYGLRSLQTFDMSYNMLDYIPAELMDSSLLIGDMRFAHNRLTYWPLNSRNYWSHLTRVTIGGNPWQCLCLRQVLAFLHEVAPLKPVRYDGDSDDRGGAGGGYFRGRKPACVVTDVDFCVRDPRVMRMTDTVRRYEAKHPKLP